MSGYAWRRQRRSRRLSSLRAACVPPCADVSEALRFALSGAGVLLETHRELATRDVYQWHVRSVLEDHELAILRVSQKLEHVLSDLTDRNRNFDSGIVGTRKQLRSTESVLVLQEHIGDWRGAHECALSSLVGVMEVVSLRLDQFEDWVDSAAGDGCGVADTCKQLVEGVRGRFLRLWEFGVGLVARFFDVTEARFAQVWLIFDVDLNCGSLAWDWCFRH